MSATDIIMETGPALLRETVLGWLLPIVPDGLAYWGIPTQRPDLPHVMVQPIGSNRARRYVGQPAGWEGEIALRAIAPDAESAASLLADAVAALPASATVDDAAYAPGWSLALRSVRPIAGLVGPSMVTRGIVYQLRLLPRSA